MRLLLLLILIPILLFGQKVISQQHIPPVKLLSTKHVTRTPSKSPTPTMIATPSISSAISPTVTTIPDSATDTPTAASIPVSNFQYPGAQQINSTTFQSSDDPVTITNWYKDKIKNLGWNTTSIVENDVNGNVSNQLSASNGSSEVRIQIMKNNNSSTVTISINQ